MLEDKIDDEDEPDEEANEDEELNEMLQRSDEELVVFRRMDAERERSETEMYRRRGYHKRLDRLIQEDELPEVFTQEEQLIVSQDSTIDFGRGRRARDEVRYDDGLTEEEWLDVSVCIVVFSIRFLILYIFFRLSKKKRKKQKWK